ncbi:MAG: hypothetical protein KF724_09360 [Phycisphaeraceae bacterium]|nr:hypothetical protein [Phycisphaeraceae bacterium]
MACCGIRPCNEPDDEGDSVDLGPSDEDLERFSGDEAHCPFCGAEVYDDAVKCPECFEAIQGATSRVPPEAKGFRDRTMVLVAIVLVLAVLGLLPMLVRF